MYKDMHYGVGMEIRSTNNFILGGGEIKNKSVYVIEKVNQKGLLTIKNITKEEILMFSALPYELYQNFIGNYASTIDGIQGSKLVKPFSIWQMNHPMFNLNRLNSAMGRSVKQGFYALQQPEF